MKALLRSIPGVANEPRVRLPTIAGSIPHPFARPTGCSFHPRCSAVIAGRCAAIEPQLAPIEANHNVSCHLYSPADPDAAVPAAGIVEIVR
jgi:peptide/nickel transport system ATP-binding protein